MKSKALLCMGILLSPVLPVWTQVPVMTQLKNVLVLEKNRLGPFTHLQSRRDLTAALNELAVEKGFSIKFIDQNVSFAEMGKEFTTAELTKYQAVLFNNADGCDRFLDSSSKINFEAYVKNGGGFVAMHSTSDFLTDWPWIQSALVQGFYGPSGFNRPKADISHDTEGLKTGTETQGIFKGLEAPLGFEEEYYSFMASPRGTLGVTILLTVDEKTFTMPVMGSMGEDHPIVWSKVEGLGRVVHGSMGHSWATYNVYASKNSYLKRFLYGSLRYVAGDFLGCRDNAYQEYNPDATKSDPMACRNALNVSILKPSRKDAQALISREDGKQLVTVVIRVAGPHLVTMQDVSGRKVYLNQGVVPGAYSIPIPKKSGLYVVVAKSAGTATRFRVTVL